MRGALAHVRFGPIAVVSQLRQSFRLTRTCRRVGTTQKGPPVGDPSKPCLALRSNGITFSSPRCRCAATHVVPCDLSYEPCAASHVASRVVCAAPDAALCRSAGQPAGQLAGRYTGPQHHLTPLAPWGALRGRTQPPVPEGKAPFDERSLPI